MTEIAKLQITHKSVFSKQVAYCNQHFQYYHDRQKICRDLLAVNRQFYCTLVQMSLHLNAAMVYNEWPLSAIMINFKCHRVFYSKLSNLCMESKTNEGHFPFSFNRGKNLKL